MFMRVFWGSIIPLIGTTLGASLTFLGRNKTSEKTNAVLSGFAGGVMVAASVWSLLLPSIEYSSEYKSFSFVPACVGLFMGIALMIFSDDAIEKRVSAIENRKTKLLFFAVTLHNIPEGMAIGAAYAAYIYSKTESLALSAFVLSMGIAIQNIPEGAIVSLPFEKEGKGKLKAFLYGVLSGIVEPVAVVITVLISGFLVPILPYMLSFAAGAMIYVVIKELIPEYVGKTNENIGIISFVGGFSVMMSLDVALG